MRTWCIKIFGTPATAYLYTGTMYFYDDACTLFSVDARSNKWKRKWDFKLIIECFEQLHLVQVANDVQAPFLSCQIQ